MRLVMLFFRPPLFFLPADFFADFLVAPLRFDAALRLARCFALFLVVFLAPLLDFFLPAFRRPPDFFDVFLDGIVLFSSASGSSLEG